MAQVNELKERLALSELSRQQAAAAASTTTPTTTTTTSTSFGTAESLKRMSLGGGCTTKQLLMSSSSAARAAAAASAAASGVPRPPNRKTSSGTGVSVSTNRLELNQFNLGVEIRRLQYKLSLYYYYYYYHQYFCFYLYYFLLVHLHHRPIRPTTSSKTSTTTNVWRANRWVEHSAAVASLASSSALCPTRRRASRRHLCRHVIMGIYSPTTTWIKCSINCECPIRLNNNNNNKT